MLDILHITFKNPEVDFSMMFKIIPLFLILPFMMSSSEVMTWIKAGYWYSGSAFPVPDIDSSLFTHLFCAFAHLNSSTYQLYISPTEESYFSTFTATVRRKNPSVTTLLSIRLEHANSLDFFRMAAQVSSRNSFIESSIRMTRLYEFQGFDIFIDPSPGLNMTNMGILLDEWRAAINIEANNTGNTRLILTMAAHYLPAVDSYSYPVNSIQKNLDWLQIRAFDYHLPSRENVTGAHSALYDPSSRVSTDYGVKQWLARGLPASKMVLGLAFHGYGWILVNTEDNGIGAPARGSGINSDGSLNYKYIKWYMKSYGATSVYNATYAVNYCIIGSLWIGFDDVEAIRTKVSYAKEKGLLGYNIWQVPNDDNWVLSRAAAEEDIQKQGNKKLVLVILLPTISVLALLGTLMFYLQRRLLKRKGKRKSVAGKQTTSPNLQKFSFADIKTATNSFSSENKLGEGGFGPVYKGILNDGQEVAVKRLSQVSRQGVEEFKNEVTVTAKLQHVNLIRLLGFCTEREERLLIYEYMPSKSLDFYLHDPSRRQLLDWEKWLRVIEGIAQGLLYLQEYSWLTIVHRDLKASNILLDKEMKPKISDFGLAKIFQKDECEASTGRIVGTYGYAPPEYVKQGIYSTKYDIYSFGVLLLHIISGKTNTSQNGSDTYLNLLEHAYELWKDGRGMEFMDPLLDDASSTCKLTRCMQVALLCVQEKWQVRPSMLEVWSMLKNETEAVPTPKRPGFSTNKDNEEDGIFTLQEENFSVDTATITQLAAR